MIKRAWETRSVDLALDMIVRLAVDGGAIYALVGTYGKFRLKDAKGRYLAADTAAPALERIWRDRETRAREKKCDCRT